MRNPEFVQKAFASIAPRYVAANHILSMGIDMLWRRRVARIVKTWRPKNILDLATGTGDLALVMQKQIPEAEITGADFCRPMLDIAIQRGLKNVIQADAMHLPLGDASFEALTVAFGLRNMADWLEALREMKRVLVPSGRLLVLDFSMPEGFLLCPYRWYLHQILPRIAGWVTGQKGAYDYLAQSIEEFPRGASMCRLIEQAGFSHVSVEKLSGGIASIYQGQV